VWRFPNRWIPFTPLPFADYPNTSERSEKTTPGKADQ